MSYRREILAKLDTKKRGKTFLPSMFMQLEHVGKGHNYFIDVGFTLTGFPQVVYVFDNIDYEPLMMDIYKLQNHSSYVDSEYGDDDKEVIIYMDVPREYRKDFDKFIAGKYSEFSDEFKAALVRKYGTDRLEGVNTKNGLPNVTVYDVIYPELQNRKNLANALSVPGSRVDYRIIKEILDAPDVEVERFKTVEELRDEYGRGKDISNIK